MASRLIPQHIPAPGSYGLNTQYQGTDLGFMWSTEANNCVIDDSGRLAARKGWSKVNTTAITGTPDVLALHEHISIAGASTIISAANLKVYSGTTTLTDRTGTITVPTDNHWQFVNFNGNVIGFQAGHTPIVGNGGNFANMTASSGTLPTGNAGLAAFGRLWAVSSDTDRTVLKYSDLLSPASGAVATAWGTGSAGSLDLKTVWAYGMDEITALAQIQGRLVIFGKKSILIYTGADDPATMTLEDHIAGIGCIARDSVQDIGTDLIFLSDSGLRSLGRTIENQTAPIGDLAKNIRDYFRSFFNTETPKLIKSCYHEPEGFYLITFPSSGRTFCFNLKQLTESGEPRVTTWTGIDPQSFLSTRNGKLYMGQAGYIGEYDDTYLDNASTYPMTFESGWTDLGEEIRGYNKILKVFKGWFQGGYNYTATYKWFYDFVETPQTASVALIVTATDTTPAEYGVAEYGVDEYGGTLGIYTNGNAPTTKFGKSIKLGLACTINQQPLVLQRFDILMKIGRI